MSHLSDGSRAPDLSRRADDNAHGPGSLLIEGRNCWRRVHAQRLTFLIDGQAYFSAFAEAARRARYSIVIIGWDIHSRTRLYANQSLPDTLGAFLNALVAKRRRLRVHVLDWDFAMIFALDREILPLFRLDWQTHRRFRFRLDGQHPLGASHHQKIVVIDDAVAFVGGLDLTINRWDTPTHRLEDERRVKPDGTPYEPFHDVQVAVAGEAAAALGVLARQRWRRATGRRLRPVRNRTREDPWPPSLAPTITDVCVGIARTDPAFGGRPEIREVERLYLDALAAAKRTIYIENQYITSAAVAASLEVRLCEPNGPEIVIVTPRQCSGWLEEGTMGALRARLLRRLRDSDRFDRLRAYYPAFSQSDGYRINVHSKVLVIDDMLARVGSANLSNRSFGLDTECDLALEAAGDARVERSIADFRSQLLAEHLGQPVESVARAYAATGSLIRTIESLRGGVRTLEPLEADPSEWDATMVIGARLADPERPIDPEALARNLLPDEIVRAPHHPLLRLAAVLGPLLMLAAAWRWTPLRDWVNPATVRQYLLTLRDMPLAPIWVALAYVVGGLVMFPVTILIASTALVFGTVNGALYAFVGSLASAAVTYGIGRLVGRDFVRRFGGRRLNDLTRGFMRRGVTIGVVPHIVPVAPFTVVNLVAGAARVPFLRYLLGTALGMVPGIIFLALVGTGLAHALFASRIVWFLALAAGVAGVFGVALWLRGRVGSGGHQVAPDEGSS